MHQLALSFSYFPHNDHVHRAGREWPLCGCGVGCLSHPTKEYGVAGAFSRLISCTTCPNSTSLAIATTQGWCCATSVSQRAIDYPNTLDVLLGASTARLEPCGVRRGLTDGQQLLERCERIALGFTASARLHFMCSNAYLPARLVWLILRVSQLCSRSAVNRRNIARLERGEPNLIASRCSNPTNILSDFEATRWS